MRKFFVPALLAVALFCSGCVTGAGIKDFKAKAAHDAGTLLASLHADLDYLQATYARLEAVGALPGLEDLARDITNLNALVTRGDLTAALALYEAARDRVTKIVAAQGV